MSLISSAGTNFLDNGQFTGAKNMPMASSSFGAETGSYFLKSTPTTLSPITEYKLEPDPRLQQQQGSFQQQQGTFQQQQGLSQQQQRPIKQKPHSPSAEKEEHRRRKKKYYCRSAAQVTESACDSLSWNTLPYCVSTSVTGLFEDVVSQPKGEGFCGVVTKNNRLLYLSILMFLIFLVYRVTRSC